MIAHRICVLICTALVTFPIYAGGYQSVRIVAPESETTVHDNNGNLAVAVEVSPLLNAEVETASFSFWTAMPWRADMISTLS